MDKHQTADHCSADLGGEERKAGGEKGSGRAGKSAATKGEAEREQREEVM